MIGKNSNLRNKGDNSRQEVTLNLDLRKKGIRFWFSKNINFGLRKENGKIYKITIWKRNGIFCLISIYQKKKKKKNRKIIFGSDCRRKILNFDLWKQAFRELLICELLISAKLNFSALLIFAKLNFRELLIFAKLHFNKRKERRKVSNSYNLKKRWKKKFVEFQFAKMKKKKCSIVTAEKFWISIYKIKGENVDLPFVKCPSPVLSQSILKKNLPNYTAYRWLTELVHWLTGRR